MLASHQLDATIICVRFNAFFSNSFVVAGAELQLSGAVFQYRNRPFHPRSISPYVRLEHFACLSFLNRLTVSPAIHHNRENTNRFRKVFWSFLCHRRVFSRLHPRLFRGVTPNCQDGQSLQTVVHVGLHIPATRKPNATREDSRTAAAHVPYTDEFKIIINCE